MGEEGVEPSWISPYDFESYAYASSATRPQFEDFPKHRLS